MAVSIGLLGSTPPEIIAALAPRIEAAGFTSLWLNDSSRDSRVTLGALRIAADATSALALATGVIPLDRTSPAEILVAAEGIPRLTLGVGSGGPRNALARVADGVRELKAGTTAPVLVGALGPKMRQLGAQRADGVLLSWLTPDAARAAMADLRRDASGGQRGVLYVRTAVRSSDRPALEKDSAAYGSYPSYAANFERLGIRAIDATIDADSLERIAEYESIVDEVVLRAIVSEPSLAAYEDFVDEAAAAR